MARVLPTRSRPPQPSTRKKAGCRAWIRLGRQIGNQLSALERRIPELFFTSQENPSEAASAGKAIAIAEAQGQRVYSIDQDNLDAVNALTVSLQIKDDIRSAVNAGQVATVHQQPVTIAGRAGIGYTLIDRETGAGAYRIAGGANGGALSIILAGIAGFLDAQTYKANQIFGM